MSTLGTTALELALLFTGIAAFTGLWGHGSGSCALTTMSRRAIYASAALVTLAVAVLLGLIFTNDFLVRMVQSSSSRDLAWNYKLALLWVDLESSMLFWSWLLSIMSALAIRLHYRRLPDLTPHAGAVMMACLGFFLCLLLFQKNPFDEFLVEAPLVGSGMRPMLRNPWMLLHPPAQYLGYIATTVPFAFGIAALVRPRRAVVDEDDWLREMRPWILGGWLFLGVGLVLGMLWAYELVDWGGWWGWDPIENASLFPWLVATALVHSALSTLRRNGFLRGMTVFLVLLTFWLTIFGTFMTRSGFVRSVHSFGEDRGLFWSFVVFMGLGMSGFGLLIARLIEGRLGPKRSIGVFTLDLVMIAVLLLLLFSAMVVVAGTLFPSLHEAIYGKRISVGPPFFQRLLVPCGLVVLALLSVAPLLSWGPMKLRRFLNQLFWPLVVFLLVILALPLAFPDHFTSGQSVTVIGYGIWLPSVSLSQLCIGLVGLTLTAALQQLLVRARERSLVRGERLLHSVSRVVVSNRRRYAAHAVHIGAALMFLGFAGKPLGQHGDRVLEPGDQWRIGGMELQYGGLVQRQGAEAEALQAMVLIRELGQAEARSVVPYIKVFYENTAMPVNEPHILRGLGKDLHVRLADHQGSRVVLRVAVHPLVSWLWIGFGVMALGCLWGIWPCRNVGTQLNGPAFSRARQRKWKPAFHAVALAWVMALGTYLAFRTWQGKWSAAACLWGVGILVLGAAAVVFWAFLPLLRRGEDWAQHAAHDGAWAYRERLLDELRSLRGAMARGELPADEARERAKLLRWELGKLLADEMARARRGEFEREAMTSLEGNGAGDSKGSGQ
ncbi:MAG: cytochrome c-type biogenesis CcmF C-terminal domain-containing protein [Polyangia bacterium]|nr:cytochrome c-type biogenesis CcmF C-terminal domain-containing protein [Polyangia bacterium]